MIILSYSIRQNSCTFKLIPKKLVQLIDRTSQKFAHNQLPFHSALAGPLCSTLQQAARLSKPVMMAKQALTDHGNCPFSLAGCSSRAEQQCPGQYSGTCLLSVRPDSPLHCCLVSTWQRTRNPCPILLPGSALQDLPLIQHLRDPSHPSSSSGPTPVAPAHLSGACMRESSCLPHSGSTACMM